MKNSVDRPGIDEEWINLCHNEHRLAHFISTVLNRHIIRSFIYKSGPSVPAGVLIPIFFKQGQAHLLFTMRTNRVATHKGQISFPGGRKDYDDRDLQFTALRETDEEVGIQPQDVTILGRTDNFLTNTNFLITPFVGIFPWPYSYKISTDEIDRLIEVPLLELLDPEIFEIKKLERHGQTWKVHYYHSNGDVIWGVTGFLLSNFLSIIFGIDRNFQEATDARR